LGGPLTKIIRRPTTARGRWVIRTIRLWWGDGRQRHKLYAYNLCIACLQGADTLSSPRAVRSKRYKWMSGLISTVLNEHNWPKAPAASRMDFETCEWFMESRTCGIVVHGNHPCSVRLQVPKLHSIIDYSTARLSQCHK
jgi:hypothetical protein